MHMPSRRRSSARPPESSSEAVSEGRLFGANSMDSDMDSYGGDDSVDMNQEVDTQLLSGKDENAPRNFPPLPRSRTSRSNRSLSSGGRSVSSAASVDSASSDPVPESPRSRRSVVVATTRSRSMARDTSESKLSSTAVTAKTIWSSDDRPQSPAPYIFDQRSPFASPLMSPAPTISPVTLSPSARRSFVTSSRGHLRRDSSSSAGSGPLLPRQSSDRSFGIEGNWATDHHEQDPPPPPLFSSDLPGRVIQPRMIPLRQDRSDDQEDFEISVPRTEPEEDEEEEVKFAPLVVSQYEQEEVPGVVFTLSEIMKQAFLGLWETPNNNNNNNNNKETPSEQAEDTSSNTESLPANAPEPLVLMGPEELEAEREEEQQAAEAFSPHNQANQQHVVSPLSAIMNTSWASFDDSDTQSQKSRSSMGSIEKNVRSALASLQFFKFSNPKDQTVPPGVTLTSTGISEMTNPSALLQAQSAETEESGLSVVSAVSSLRRALLRLRMRKLLRGSTVSSADRREEDSIRSAQRGLEEHFSRTENQSQDAFGVLSSSYGDLKSGSNHGSFVDCDLSDHRDFNPTAIYADRSPPKKKSPPKSVPVDSASSVSSASLVGLVVEEPPPAELELHPVALSSGKPNETEEAPEPKDRSIQFLGAILATVLFLILIIALSVSLTRRNDDNEDEVLRTNPPTPAPVVDLCNGIDPTSHFDQCRCLGEISVLDEALLPRYDRVSDVLLYLDVIDDDAMQEDVTSCSPSSFSRLMLAELDVEIESLVQAYVAGYLYQSWDGFNWERQENWLQTPNVCEWEHVACDSLQQISRLSLDENGLQGTIPSEINLLTNIRELQLSGNSLTGRIDDSLFTGLLLLRSLDLSLNLLQGRMQDVIPRLMSLDRVHLNGNDFTGDIPEDIASLENLRELQLGDNRLGGTIPAKLGQLVELEELGLSNCQLTGVLPSELGMLTDVKQVNFGRNELTGTIPGEFTGMERLEWLDVGFTTLTGFVPIGMCDLVELETIIVSCEGDFTISGECPCCVCAETGLPRDL